MHLQESGEMYLETIYVLSKNGVVRSLDVAEYMGFSKPSVSRAVGLLKQGGYLLMDKEGYLTLTESGRKCYSQRQGVARCHQRRDGEENHDMTALRRSTYSVVPNRYKPPDKRLISDAEQF